MKKQVLYFIIVLALVLSMTLPTVMPVMASEIGGNKAPIPLLPNIYYIDDTIFYEMMVNNPGNNTATNYLSRVWDTLPNGTEIELLDPGETLIQAPGDEATFYGNYTVAAADIVWLPGLGYYGVVNEFEAEGVNSYGARVHLYHDAPSRVIRPDSEVTIVDAPATVVSGQAFDLTITEENTGFDEITDPYVEVWKNGALLATLEAPPDSGDVADPGVLNVGETWSWTIQDTSITETTTFVALGFGTDPLGNEVSYATDYLEERDEVTVTAMEGGIDIEKYVSVDGGLSWEDADSAPFPEAVAGNNVLFKVVVCNNGTAPLTNILVNDTDFAFTGVATALAPGACDESDVKIVAAVVGDQYDLATVTAEADGVQVADYDPANYTGLGPGIDIEKYISIDGGLNWADADSAPGPSAVVGKNVSFKVVVCNNGTEPLTNISVGDTDFTFTGVATSLIAGACDESDVLTVAVVDGLQYDLATVNATADGVQVTDNDPAYYTGLTPGIDIEKYVSVDGGLNWADADSAPGPSALVGMNVSFKVRVCNNGTAPLTNISVGDTDFTFTGVATSLIAGACDESDVLIVTAVNGLQYDLATVNATAEGVPVTDEDPAYYSGSPPPPAIDIEKYTNGEDADYAPGPYVSINSTITWTYNVTNTGGVNLTNIVVTDDNGTPGNTVDDFNPSPVDVSPADGFNDGDTDKDNELDLTEAWLYRATGTAIAGYYANIGYVTGTPLGGDPVVSASDPSHYYSRLPVGWETYPINKVRVLLPWIAVAAAIIGGAILLVIRRRRLG